MNLYTYIENLKKEQDNMLYFEIFQCKKCGKYTRYLYGGADCRNCFYEIKSEIKNKYPKYYEGDDVIYVDGISYGKYGYFTKNDRK